MGIKQVLDDRYEIWDTIKSGGFGVVYKGYDIHMDRHVVIKGLHAYLTDDAANLDSFTDEAMISAQLIHPNIVQVYNFLRTPENRFYLVMELVDGRDLERILSRLAEKGQRMDPLLVAYIGSCIAKALDYAHTKRETTSKKEMQIVHRDVTPGNILISYEGRAKLSDFGIMKAATRRAEKTEVGAVKGKYRYMSPEQARGEDVDRRTDVYALGICMYEAATGEKPFRDSSDYKLLLKASKGEFGKERKNLAKHNIPQELISVIHKCTDKNARKRYQSAKDIYLDLENYLNSANKTVDETMLSDLMTKLYREQKEVTNKEETVVLREAAVIHQKEDEERTVFDMIRGSAQKYKKMLVSGLIGLFCVGLGLFAMDVFQWHKTGMGRTIYDSINPPDVIINSLPEGKALYLDGEERGTTPCLVAGIKPGVHNARFGSSNHSTRRSIEVKSRIEVGDGTQNILIPLQVEFSISSIPSEASIYRDSKEYDTTPLNKHIEVEAFNITLSKDGFEPIDCPVNLADIAESVADPGFDRRFCELTSEPSGKVTLLVRLPRKVTIVARPSDGSLFIDDEPISEQELLIPAGKHTVRMERKGYESKEQEEFVDENTDEIRMILHRYVTVSAKNQDTGERIKNFSVTVRADNKTLGTFRSHKILLPGEKCRLTFKSKGFKSRSYSLSPNAFSQLAQLRLRKPKLVVQVVDAGTGALIADASIWYANAPAEEPSFKGQTRADKPYSLEVSPGYCRIKVTASELGYEEATVEEEISQGGTRTVRIEMRRSNL